MKSKQIARALVFLPLGLLMMGNQKCEDQNTMRELRRRVQMGSVQAPPMPLPDGGSFDFKFAANAQMYDVLRRTTSFSTSTNDGSSGLDTTQMTQEERDAFNQCEDSSAQMMSNDLFSKVMTQNSACMIHMPQAVINTDIVNFELTSSGGISIGIADWANLGVGLTYKKATLTMAMRADDPLIPGHVIAASTPKAKRQEFAVNLSANPGGVGIGLNFYSKTDLAKVVSTAMEKGIVDLKQQFDLAEGWYGQVLKNCDKAILINAGNSSDAGLQVGDQFEVYNMWYDWEGEACNSTLLGVMKSTQKPIAVVEVEIVGNTFSQARVIEQTEVKILPGARVYVKKLYVPPTQKKSQSAKAVVATK
jgi:hypothetical protein